MKLILPCAGFGVRMGMEPNKSKELLDYHGKPLIENSLLFSKLYSDITPVVITRKEKTDLIDYCNNKNICTEIIEVEGEWADTVLKSKRYWEEDNLLILPDTVFDPFLTSITEIRSGLDLGNNAVFALHIVGDPWNWGTILNYTLREKSPSIHPCYAWGIIGFKKDYGEQLFSNCKKGKELKLENCGFTYLNSFKDLTRTGKIEA